MNGASTPPSSPVEGASHGVPAEGLGFDLPAPARFTAARVVATGLVLALGLSAAFVAGYLPRQRTRHALMERAQGVDTLALRVEVVPPRPGATSRAMVLPGSVRPWEQATLYARANGYLHRWLVDLGDPVHEGQLLAEIDTPEIDQELSQARAQLAQAEAMVLQATASRDLAQADLERYRTLAPSGYASRQDIDQRQAAASVASAALTVAHAAVGAQRANVQRLQQLKSFGRVTAPFAGIITARTVDRGALVTAGSGTPLFTLASTDPVRVYVQVPQDVAPSVHAGLTANVTVREHPGTVLHGVVSRTAGVLDPTTRTLSTEVRVANPTGTLLAGMYAEVAITLPTPHRVFELPATAVLSDASGLRVAVVSPEGTVHLQPVVIERDTGAVVQISQGLTGSERVARIANPALREGRRVDVVH